MSSIRRHNLEGIIAVLLSATCFAVTAILLKKAFMLELSPLEILALQSWLASLILLIYTVFFRREVFKVSLRFLIVISLQGIAGSLGTSVFYAYSLKLLPVSVATLLLYLYPVLVIGAGVLLFNKTVSRQEGLALFLTLLGTVTASGVFLGVENVSMMGILFGIGAAASYAVFNLVGEIALNEVSPLTTMCFSQWVSTVGLFIYFRGDITRIPWTSPGIWQIGLALATIASILPFYLVLVGIQRIGADKASILSTFELPMTFFLAALFLNETPTLLQIVGGGLVLGGIILLNRRKLYVKEP
ncbi:MAG: DMT family transporter [Desulfitobacterium hafniense]|nr:DMT family transporter [Desulfitobacterium hafniense]